MRTKRRRIVCAFCVALLVNVALTTAAGPRPTIVVSRCIAVCQDVVDGSLGWWWAWLWHGCNCPEQPPEAQ